MTNLDKSKGTFKLTKKVLKAINRVKRASGSDKIKISIRSLSESEYTKLQIKRGILNTFLFGWVVALVAGIYTHSSNEDFKYFQIEVISGAYKGLILVKTDIGESAIKSALSMSNLNKYLK